MDRWLNDLHAGSGGHVAVDETVTVEVEHGQNGLNGHIHHIFGRDGRPGFHSGWGIGAPAAARGQKSGKFRT